jgi:DNA repair exonuclease SbcCD ATPase subunit
MSILYLNRLEITDFRSFGPTFSYTPPPGPSVSIVYGMNGLGKTTFFEAIEWALTGDVRRLSSQIKHGQGKWGDYLTRRGAVEQSHRVSINFTDCSDPLTRTADITPTSSELVSRFKSPTWRTAIEDVTPYFRLTMFLPQSRKHRFEEEEPGEKWRLLEGPAGVKRLERIRQALGSTKAGNAFKRSVSDAQAVIDKMESDLSRWKELLSIRMSIAARWNPTVEISFEQAIDYLRGLVASINEIAVRAVEVSLDGEDEVATAFEDLKVIVDGTIERIESRLLELQTLGKLVEEHTEVVVAIKYLEEAIEKNSQVLINSKKQLADTDATIRLRDSETEANELAQKKESLKLDNLRRLQTAMKDRTNCISKSEDISKANTDIELEIEEVQAKIESAQNLITQDLQMQEKLVALLGEVRDIEADIKQMEKWLAFVLQKDAIDSSIREFDQQKSELITQRTNASTGRATLQAQIDTLTIRLEAELERANRLERSVADVVDLIDESMTSCPVCSTGFDVGKLRDAARESLEKRGVGNRAISDEIRTKTEEVLRVDSEIAVLDLGLSAIAAKLANAHSELAMVESATRSIEEFRLKRGFPEKDVLVALRANLDIKQLELAKQREQHTPLGENVASTLKSDTQRLSEVTEKRNQGKKDLVTLNAEVVRLNAVISALQGDLFNGVIPLMNAIEEEIASSSELLEKMSIDRREIQSLRSTELGRLTAIQGEIERISQAEETESIRLNQQIARRDSLFNRWQKFGLAGQPSITVLENARAKEEEKASRISQVQRELKRLAEGYNSWKASSELKQHEKVIADFGSKFIRKDFDQTTAYLQEQIDKAKVEYNRRLMAFDRAKEISDSLKNKADEFNDLALKPLQSRIQEFHNVLSPFRYSIRLQSRSRASNPTRLEQTVSYQDSLGQESVSPPFAELSDGQLAVQGLSTLLAASVEYRWCRWPALLLDDPLQSTDLIHTSAFIDIVRGLVKDLGYQIFISSHDLDEAEYIARKCERSNIDVGRCHLLGPGINGVRYECSR